ncbi:MAG: ABC transporter permease [Gemmatimonadota bacterium]|nr:MAG: ABC transporter permease [Gemmatimonadota bacterium]
MRPPRPATWLIARALASQEREWILGDLEEVFGREVVACGSTRARLWYWRQAISFSVRFVRERWSGRDAGKAFKSGAREPVGGLVRDVRYALRTLTRSPGFALVAVVTLALGIGANTAIFSVVNSILLRPLPVADADRLVSLCETNPAIAGFCIASPGNVEDWAQQSNSFESIGVARDWPFILKTDEGVQGIRGGIATPAFFNVLQFRPALGRLFVPEDLEPGNNRVVVLSDATWRSRFGSDVTIVGRNLTLGDEIYTVIGVLPAEAEVPRMEGFQLWAPLHFHPREQGGRSWRGFRALGRLAAGVTITEADAEMSTIAVRLAEQYPETNDGWGIRLVHLHEQVVGSVRPMLLVFLGAVGFVLLIGCANVANLLLARSSGRRRELAVRTALGASRGRLLRLLLSESVLLAVAGGGAGLLLAVWAVSTFVSLAPGSIPRLDEVAIDGRVLGFALLVSLLTSLVFGLLPSLQATSLNLNEELKEGDRASSSGRLGIRSLLVVSQVALALMLLIGAALLTQSFATLLRWKPGFDQSNLLTVWLLASTGKYESADQVSLVFEQAVEEVGALPSVESVGRTSAGPLFGGRETDEFVIEGRPLPAPGDGPVARWFDVGPKYFGTLGVPLVKGRGLEPSDAAGMTPVAVINESAVRRYWPGEDPLGQRVTIRGETRTIVGVVSDVRPLRPGTPIDPEVYWPQAQSPRYATFLVIRTKTDPLSAVEGIRKRLQQLDPDMRVSSLTTLRQRMSRELVGPRFNMLLIGIFASVALLLAAVGIYGVVAYTVARRTREMGIRVALGARGWDIVRSVAAHGMVPTTVGLVLGLLGAVGLTRVLESLLFGVSPTDPVTFAGVAVVLAAVAALACYVPARRATRVEAVVALREE